MIRHVVFFSIRVDASAKEADRLIEDIRRFPEAFPAMRRFAVGRNASDRDDAFSHAMAVDFAHRAELDAYLASERHEEFVRDRFRPLVSKRAIATLEVEPWGEA